MIKFEHISKQFDEKSVLIDISLELPSIGLVLIYGESGCGKSTLINILLNTVKCTSGEVFFNGNQINTTDEINKGGLFSCIFQDNNLLNDLSVYDNIKICSNVERNDKINEVLQYLKIAKYINTPVKKLSAGEKQRVAVARAMIRNSPVILADEPTSNLDRANGEIILSKLAEIARNRLIILVSHDVGLVSKYASRIIKIDNGRIARDEIVESIDRPNKCIVTTQNENLQKSIITEYAKCKLQGSMVKQVSAVSILSFISILIIFCICFLTFNPYHNYVKGLNSQSTSRLIAQEGNIDTDMFAELNKDNNLREYYKCYLSELRSSSVVVDNSLEQSEINVSQSVADNLIDYDQIVGEKVIIKEKEYTIKGVYSTTIEDEQNGYYNSIAVSHLDIVDILWQSDIRSTTIDHETITIKYDEELSGTNTKLNISMLSILCEIYPEIMSDFEQDGVNISLDLYKNMQQYTTVNIDCDKDDIIDLIQPPSGQNDAILIVSIEQYTNILYYYLDYGILVSNSESASILRLHDEGIDIHSDRYELYEVTDQIFTYSLIPLLVMFAVVLVLFVLYMCIIMKNILIRNKRDFYVLKLIDYPSKFMSRMTIVQFLPIGIISLAVSCMIASGLVLMIQKLVVAHIIIDFQIWISVIIFMLGYIVVNFGILYLQFKKLSKNANIGNLRE